MELFVNAFDFIEWKIIKCWVNLYILDRKDNL